MKRSFENEPEANELLDGFELEPGGEGWLERLRVAIEPPRPGRLGDYEDVREVGRGGQGVVYRARRGQSGPVLAIKRLTTASWASDAARRRFEREVETAASLQHPSIVRVHGLEVVRGEPLISMEWIEGERIDRWVERREPRRDPGRILPLFLAVCDAVQHAHQRGVIHRDLKPSNILVDEAGLPRLLDFGLAKQVDPQDDRATLTRSSHFLGTPAYSAPEQFRGGAEADVRADVYSLGVLLFELLTGELPFDVPESALEWIRRVDRVEARRLAAVKPRLGRELDAILYRALRPEREERYQSVDALSGDLRRHERGEPILAHPPSALYQLGKLVRRHPWPFALAGSLLVLGGLFSVRSAAQAERIRVQRDRAIDAERVAANRLLDVQRAHAKTRAALQESAAQAARARAVQEFLIDDLLMAANPAVALEGLTVLEAVQRAAAGLEQGLEREPATRAAVHGAVGVVFEVLRRYDEAEEHLRASVAGFTAAFGPRHPETLRARSRLGSLLVRTRRLESGEEVLRDVLAEQEREPEALGRWRTLGGLARVALARGDPTGAEKGLRAALERHAVEHGDEPPPEVDLWNVLVTSLLEQGRELEAEELLGQLIDSNPREDAGAVLAAAGHLQLLGQMHHARLNLERAEDLLVQSLDLRRDVLALDSPWIGAAQVNIAQVRGERGAYAGALDLVDEGLERMRASWDETDTNVLTGCKARASVQWSAGRHAHAEELYRELIGRFVEVYGEHSTQVADLLGCAGFLASSQGRNAEALEDIERSLEILSDLPRGQGLRARNTYYLAQTLMLLQRWPEALRRYHEAINGLHQHYGEDHGLLPRAMANAARLHSMGGNFPMAIEVGLEGMRLERLRGEEPTAETVLFVGEMCLRDRRLEEAVRLLERGYAMVREPGHENLPEQFGSAMMLGHAHLLAGAYGRAEPLLLEALDGLGYQRPDRPSVEPVLRRLLGDLYRSQGEPERAAAYESGTER